MSRGPPYPGTPDGVGARPEPVDPEPVDDGPNQASPQGAKRRLSVLSHLEPAIPGTSFHFRGRGSREPYMGK
jgi:hypothetical protein